LNLATDAACINKSKLHHCHIKAIGIDATQEQLEMIKKMFPLFIDQAVPFEYILDGTSLRLSDIASVNLHPKLIHFTP